MFSKVSKTTGKTITIYFEEQPVLVEEGITVAAAVMHPAHGWSRTNHNGQKRGPFCHMGVCFECLMTINGVPNQQACLTVVADGMRVSRQNGVPDFHKKEKENA
jgi:Uncharacterized anaerobic dehydrogenase